MTQPGNIAKSEMSLLVKGEADVSTSFEGPVSKQRKLTIKAADPTLGHDQAVRVHVVFLILVHHLRPHFLIHYRLPDPFIDLFESFI